MNREVQNSYRDWLNGGVVSLPASEAQAECSHEFAEHEGVTRCTHCHITAEDFCKQMRLKKFDRPTTVESATQEMIEAMQRGYAKATRPCEHRNLNHLSDCCAECGKTKLEIYMGEARIRLTRGMTASMTARPMMGTDYSWLPKPSAEHPAAPAVTGVTE